MALKKYSPRVPRDYQEIEYLKCNGTQYIDTGLVGSDLSNCEIEAIMKNETTDTTAYNFNGAFLSGSTAQFGLVATSSTECRATINFGFVSALGITNLALSQYHTFYLKNGLQKVDGVTIDTLDFGTLNGQKFLLFARTNSSDSSITNCPAMSLKAFSVKSNGSYIRNMIPVRRISDGELGLYDTANNVFYTNQGTNSFIAGSDVDNWKDIPYCRYETATDVVTSLPVTVYGDGETDISLLLKGNTETSGNPSPQNPVTVDGVGEETANLLDWSYFEDGYYLDNTTGLPAIYTPSPSRIATTSPIDVSDFNNVTFSFTSNATVPLYIYSLFNGNTLIRRVANNANGASIDTSEGDKLYLCIYSNSSNITTSNVTKAMLNEGTTALPYDEYNKYKISILKGLTPLTPIYLTQPLMKIATTSDNVNSSNTVTYNIRKLVMDSNVSITDSGTSGNYHRYSIRLDGCSNRGSEFSTDVLTTHYRIQTGWGNGNAYLYSEFLFISLLDSEYPNSTALKSFFTAQYEAGTPVTVWYILATPTTESITAPTITTTGGEVSIDVDTTVKPSELELTYHGWHTHEPLKRENGQWV